MHGAHDPARGVGADGDEAEGKGAAVLADGGEGGAVREVRVGFRVVICRGGVARNGAVTCVAGEID